MAASEPSKTAPKLALLCSVYAKSYSIGSRAKGRAAAKWRIFPKIINNRLPALWPSTCFSARLYIQKMLEVLGTE